MSGQRQPIELVLAKGKWSLTGSIIIDLARAILLSKLSEYILKL